MDVRRVASICRSCTAFCPIVVTVVDGRPVKVEGDRGAPLFQGYTCSKGRALPEAHTHESRLLYPLRRRKGGFDRISSETALKEIALRVRGIVDRYGPRSVAVYNGTGGTAHPTGTQMGAAWLKALGSSLSFGANAIDKPAANIANALHGTWIAGPQSFETSDTWLIVGANPVIAKSNGAPQYNPARRLKDAINAGMQLIVIDPRVTETARRAVVHLQAWPGQDPAILAGMLRIILAERLQDETFIAAHTEGLALLREAVDPFTPIEVERRAGVEAAKLVQAVRIFARAKRGCGVCSTGPSFSTHSNLSYYLTLCLNTICGRWTRAGEVAPHPNVLLPAYTPKAQPRAPFNPITGPALRVRGLSANASGLPTAALPDEILTEGEGRVRALFCIGGNPILAFPDQARTHAALQILDLLVVFDPVMSATAEMADFVLGTALSLEVPGSTYTREMLKFLQPTRGLAVPFAQYTPRVVGPPSGSDVVEEADFFFRLAQRMGLEIQWTNSYGWSLHHESPPDTISLDMSRVPPAEELLELKCRKSRISLDEVKAFAHGHVFDEEPLIVAPADKDCRVRLQLGDRLMMVELHEIAISSGERQDEREYPFLLVSRRANHVNNSIGRTLPSLMRDKPYNPLHIHPADIAELGIVADGLVAIRSRRGEIVGVAEVDTTLKPGVVAMTQGFGRSPECPDMPLKYGACVSRLVALDECDPITGIPRMSAIPVSIGAAAPRLDPLEAPKPQLWSAA